MNSREILEISGVIARQMVPKRRLEVADTEEKAKVFGCRLGDTVQISEPIKFDASPGR